MRPLSKQLKLSLNQKKTHIFMILEKRNLNLTTTDSALQFIHDLRLCCLVLAYFQPKIPDEISQNLPFNIEEKILEEFNILDTAESEKLFILAFKEAYKKIKEEYNYSYFDEADRSLKIYKFNKWRESEEKDGWKLVETKTKRKRTKRFIAQNLTKFPTNEP